MPRDEHNNNDLSMIGRIIVEQQLATPEQISAAEATFRQLPAGEATPDRMIELLVGQGVVTAAQIKRVRSMVEQRRSPQQIPGYKLMEKVGQGAMGIVYRAKQVSLDRTVAIKVLPKKHTEEPNFVERFYAEGRAAARLNHPNIVQAIDVGQSGDWHYFIMEFVEGSTVFDHLQQHGRYSEAEALKITIQLAEALKHAHELGFMHRDVKPKNIMFNAKGVTKLADMGLARQVSDKEAAEAEAGKAYGTPYYISPEQIRGAVDVDQRADIYGLGATFYHMVTGRVPFEGTSPSAVMHKHLKQPLVPPDHINPSLSAGVSEIIEVMMAKDRDERYRNAADLLEDLRAVQAGNPPIHARKKFSLASLAALEDTAEHNAVGDDDEGEYGMRTYGGPPLVAQPLFWVALASAGLNIFLLFLMFSR